MMHAVNWAHHGLLGIGDVDNGMDVPGKAHGKLGRNPADFASSVHKTVLDLAHPPILERKTPRDPITVKVVHGIQPVAIASYGRLAKAGNFAEFLIGEIPNTAFV